MRIAGGVGLLRIIVEDRFAFRPRPISETAERAAVVIGIVRRQREQSTFHQRGENDIRREIECGFTGGLMVSEVAITLPEYEQFYAWSNELTGVRPNTSNVGVTWNAEDWSINS